MVVIIITALLLISPFPNDLLKNTTLWATRFQNKCIQLLPRATEHRDSIAALVCGKKLEDKNLERNLSKTSLIHIFVVSGSHLILLDELLSILKIPVFLRFMFLGGYSLCAGWQAPAVRALCGLVVKKVFQQLGLFFKSDQTVLITGFICLILFPAWWHSMSFLMSWCAALALCLPAVVRIKNHLLRSLFTHFFIYFFMLAPLAGFGSLHPLGILYNIFLAPFVAYVLLPLSFIALFFKPFLFLFDQIVEVFGFLLQSVSDPIHLKNPTSPQLNLLWSWIFCLQIACHFLRLYLWQGNHE